MTEWKNHSDFRLLFNNQKAIDGHQVKNLSIPYIRTGTMFGKKCYGLGG